MKDKLIIRSVEAIQKGYPVHNEFDLFDEVKEIGERDFLTLMENYTGRRKNKNFQQLTGTKDGAELPNLFDNDKEPNDNFGALIFEEFNSGNYDFDEKIIAKDYYCLDFKKSLNYIKKYFEASRIDGAKNLDQTILKLISRATSNIDMSSQIINRHAFFRGYISYENEYNEMRTHLKEVADEFRFYQENPKTYYLRKRLDLEIKNENYEQAEELKKKIDILTYSNMS